MASSRVILTVMLLAFVLNACCLTDWSYRKPNGKRYDWTKSYPECGGHRQSPIDLKDFTEARNGLRFNYTGGYVTNGYQQPIRVTNDGNTVLVTSENKIPPTITFSDGKIFQLDHVHFYWGRTVGGGSEHTINGQRFAIEVQAVHNRVDENGTLISPAETVIMTNLYKMKRSSGDINALMEDEDEFADAGKSVRIEEFYLISLASVFDRNYYLYQGSLTTPPCSEVVTFIISAHVDAIDIDALKSFGMLRGKYNKTMDENFRYLQKRNGRKIYHFRG